MDSTIMPLTAFIRMKIINSRSSHQPSKFTLTVGNCQGFCRGKQCFYSNHLSKNIAEVINS